MMITILVLLLAVLLSLGRVREGVKKGISFFYKDLVGKESKP